MHKYLVYPQAHIIFRATTILAYAKPSCPYCWATAEINVSWEKRAQAGTQKAPCNQEPRTYPRNIGTTLSNYLLQTWRKHFASFNATRQPFRQPPHSQDSAIVWVLSENTGWKDSLRMSSPCQQEFCLRFISFQWWPGRFRQMVVVVVYSSGKGFASFAVEI